MAYSLGEKTFRAMRFLIGVRNPRIATALAGYGFKESDMDEGWALVNALGKGKLAFMPAEPRDMETLLKLDAWENQWFPIAAATLGRRFPVAAATFLLNLQQTEGPEVAISVRTFVDRYREMAAGDAKYGAEGKKAVELLAERGVTSSVVQEADMLLKSLARVAKPAEPVSIEEQEAELEAAEEALWAWYLEWSKIARVAVKQRVLLKQLGFLASRRGGADDDGEVESPPPTPEPKPPAPPSPIAGAPAN